MTRIHHPPRLPAHPREEPMSEQLDPVVDLVRNAIGYGVMMALENRTGLIRRMQDAGPGVTMTDLLAEDAAGFVQTRADLVEAVQP